MAFDPPPRPVFIKVRTTFFKTIKYYPIKNIFNFLQGLVGFGNLRFAEIKSCPSASPILSKKTVQKNSGKGTPPQIRAMPELKRFFGYDCFPKCQLYIEASPKCNGGVVS